jgi:hypothetical protein
MLGEDCIDTVNGEDISGKDGGDEMEISISSYAKKRKSSRNSNGVKAKSNPKSLDISGFFKCPQKRKEPDINGGDHTNSDDDPPAKVLKEKDVIDDSNNGSTNGSHVNGGKGGSISSNQVSNGSAQQVSKTIM